MIKSPYATSLTRTGKLDPTNRKPYRTPAMKAEALAVAVKTDKGFFTSTAPVLYAKK